MELILLGCNFKTTSLQEREAWAAQISPRRFGAVCLSTCNRVEIYAAIPQGTSLESLLAAWEVTLRPAYVHRNGAVFSHLVRVTSGLDSMVLGETEVAGQVKRAYQKALEEGVNHPLLHFLFQRAFSAAKKIRTETGISRLPVSVSSVGLMLLEQIFGRFEKVRAAVAGLGEMGKQTALGLAKKKVGRLILFGRNRERAKLFAEQLPPDVEIFPLEALDDHLGEIDLLITASRQPGFLVSALHDLPRAPLKVFLDLGVPRNLDPALGQRENLFLYNVDDLKEIAAKNLAGRRLEAQAAEAMIQKELLIFEKEWGNRAKISLEDREKVLVQPKLSGA